MITDLNVIVKEWAYRVHNGKPNPNNSAHLYQLSEILIENKWPMVVVDEFIQNLDEAKVTKKDLQKRIASMSSGLSTPTNTSRVANDGDLSDDQFIKLLKKEFNIDKVEVLKPLSGKNKSSKFNMFSFEYDDTEYDIILAGKISGRGTAQTKDQELAFLLTLSAIHAAANPKEKEDFLSMMLNPSIYKEVYDGSSLS